jgi:hypothetical protein
MKKFICLILVVMFVVCLVGCQQQEDPVKKDLETVKVVADIFEEELANFGVDEEMVDTVITKIEEYNEEAKYVIAFDVQNENMPVLNMTIHLPVDQYFFDSVEIGDRVAEEVLENIEQFDQSLGGWIITVKDKIVRE